MNTLVEDFSTLPIAETHQTPRAESSAPVLKTLNVPVPVPETNHISTPHTHRGQLSRVQVVLLVMMIWGLVSGTTAPQ